MHPGAQPQGIALERWRLSVEGKVQGVGYRAACCRQAQSLGLAGWVRNRSDGRVELEAEGNAEQLQALRLWCERGPSLARVGRVTTLPIGLTGTDWFEVLS
ncbi:acylphosphatase [Cyanobium sp. LEGE 06113]|nr:acylphosphatase [Cyanobium sp. LEGE 06113]MBE9153022.1 acylphosphatase [Cyanobium sp. LEGE 06113]